MAVPLAPSPAPYASLELPAATRPDRLRRAALLAAGWTAYGLVFAAMWTATARPELPPADVLHQIVLSLVPAWAWALCTPLVVAATRRAAPARVGWARSLATHGALALAIALAVSGARRGVNLVMVGPGEATAFWQSFSFWLDHNCFAYAVVAGVTRALDLHRGVLARTRRELGLQAELAHARLHFLRAQLQPHFLFNCLNATAELAREEPLVAQRMLRHLQQLLRAALARRDAEEIALRDELATLDPYVELQRMRFGRSLEVVRRVDPAALGALVPAFVLQPLVENAIQHGLAARPGGGIVEVAATVANGRLRLTVRDDGPGPVSAAAAFGGRRRPGIGLRNTRDRLLQLHGDDHTFMLAHEAGVGTVATLDLPLRWAEAAGAPADARDAGASLPDFADVDTMPAIAASRARLRTPAGVPVLAGAMPTATDEFRVPDAGVATHAAGTRRVEQLRAGEWLAIGGFWLAVGVMWIVQNALRQYVAYGTVAMWAQTTIDFWNAMTWAVMTPAVLLLARRARLSRRHWRRALLVHVGAALVVDVVHLALLLRLVAALGLLDRPLFASGNVSQLVLNLVIYAGVVTWSHAHQFAAWHRERVLAAARLDTQLAEARWQALALELRPEFLLALLERIARVAPEDPMRAERLVERLSDLLRATLDTVGHATQPLRAELAQLAEWLALWGEATAREVSLQVELSEPALDRPVSAGAFRALTNLLLAHEPPAGATVALTIGTTPRAGRLALRVRSSVPLRPAGSSVALDGVPSWTGASFPDARTAELDLGPADAAPADGAPALALATA